MKALVETLVRAITLIAALGAARPVLARQTEAGPWLLRLRAVGLFPVVDANSPIGGDIEVGAAWSPELDVSRFLSDHVALELVIGTARHRVRVIESRLGDLDLGSVRVVPIVLTAQVHALPRAGLRTYGGLGISRLDFLDATAPGPLITRVTYEDALAIVLQGGFDCAIGSGPWALNVDVKKAFFGTTVSLDGGFLTANARIDPWIVGIGLAYRLRSTG